MARPVTFDSGQVTLRDGHLRLLKGEGEAVAEAPIGDVRYWQPKIFMGDGVKVTVGESGDFTVTPSKNGLFALGHARRWSKRFIEALRELGAQPVS